MLHPRLIPTKLGYHHYVKTRRFVALLASLLFAPAAWAGVEVNVAHVGYPTVGRGDVVRSSAWAPIIVDLALTEQQAGFDGYLRAGQFDLDGDEAYDRVEVHLRAESGGNQRLYLYIIPNPRRVGGQVFVELFDSENRIVQVVSQGELIRRAAPAQPPELIEDDDILILEVTTGTGGRVQDLVAADQRDRYLRHIHVGLTSPNDLPEMWLGLEMVDYVIWESANPGDLTEKQLGALLEWVRNGGTILMAASRTAGALAQTKSIQQILPVTLGEVQSIDSLPITREALVGVADQEDIDEKFDPAVPAVKCAVRAGAKVIVGEEPIAVTRKPGEKPKPQPVSIESDMVTSTSYGRGFVLFCGICLKDLFSAPGSAPEFFRQVFSLPLRAGDESAQRAAPRSLFGNVIGAISFATSGTFYLFVALVFSLVYAVLATFGAWKFLGRRHWLQHSWTTFAAIAVAASFISLVAVRAVHGIGETLHQLTMIDAAAGDIVGHGFALFGVKSSVDKRLDVWLPSDPLSETEPSGGRCFLRAVPAGDELAEGSTSFSDPQEYRLIPGSAVVEDVRLRATLKRLEGRWTGPLGGSLTGSVSLHRVVDEDLRGNRKVSWRVTDDSFIVNGLGVELENCYLFYAPHDLGPTNTAGLSPGRLRDLEMFAFPMGTLPSGPAQLLLAPRCYAVNDPRKVHEFIQSHRLRDAHGEWGGRITRMISRLTEGLAGESAFALGAEENALMLLSTIGEYDYTQHGGVVDQFIQAHTWSRDRSRWFDVREHVQQDSVWLIGFADGAGPVKLFRREGDRPYRALDASPTRSKTMYRIRIPAKIAGQTLTADDAEEAAPKPSTKKKPEEENEE